MQSVEGNESNNSRPESGNKINKESPYSGKTGNDISSKTHILMTT